MSAARESSPSYLSDGIPHGESRPLASTGRNPHQSAAIAAFNVALGRIAADVLAKSGA